MNYPQSPAILQTIQAASKILLNCHRSPDPDSIGSTLALAHALKTMGKQIAIVCPDVVDPRLTFLKGSETIQAIDFNTFDFASYDLFIILDSASWEQVTNSKTFVPSTISIIVMDHHVTNTIEAPLKLIDTSASATAEMMYMILSDWGTTIDANMATALFAGLSDDCVFFKHTKNAQRIFKIASELMQRGADKDRFVYEMYSNYDVSDLKLLGKILSELKIESYGFAWSAVPYALYEQFGKPEAAKEIAASQFMQSVKNSEFGMVMVEKNPGVQSISFRSKGAIDVAALAQRLGGGGHKKAAGCTVKGNFEDTLARVLQEARACVTP